MQRSKTILKHAKSLLADHGLDVGLLVLRLWFGLILAFGHGWGKIGGFEKFSGYVASQGFWLPDLAAAFAVASEVGGGILLALGIFFRPAAFAVVATMLGAALVVHSEDPFSKMELALAYAMVGSALFFTGPGRLTAARLLNRASDTPN